eukprot:6190718-Pleurochrysis_carterae.AAC.1
MVTVPETAQGRIALAPRSVRQAFMRFEVCARARSHTLLLLRLLFSFGRLHLPYPCAVNLVSACPTTWQSTDSSCYERCFTAARTLMHAELGVRAAANLRPRPTRSDVRLSLNRNGRDSVKRLSQRPSYHMLQ